MRNTRRRTTNWKTTMRKRAMFGITRIDSGHTHCWWVRLGYNKHGRPQFHEAFSDGVWGGKMAAKTKAIQARNAQLRHRD